MVSGEISTLKSFSGPSPPSSAPVLLATYVFFSGQYLEIGQAEILLQGASILAR